MAYRYTSNGPTLTDTDLHRSFRYLIYLQRRRIRLRPLLTDRNNDAHCARCWGTNFKTVAVGGHIQICPIEIFLQRKTRRQMSAARAIIHLFLVLPCYRCYFCRGALTGLLSVELWFNPTDPKGLKKVDTRTYRLSHLAFPGLRSVQTALSQAFARVAICTHLKFVTAAGSFLL